MLFRVRTHFSSATTASARCRLLQLGQALGVVLVLSQVGRSGAFSAETPPSNPKLLPIEAAARVNGNIITRQALTDVVAGLTAQMDEIPASEEIGKLRREALESLIEFELLYQESQARHLAVSDAAVADQIRKTEKRFSSPRAYQEALSSKGLTRQDIERDTRKALVVDLLMDQEMSGKARVPDNVIRDYYQKHADEFRHPEEVRARHILVRIPEKGTAKQKAEARAKAEALLERLRKGERFEEVARASSDDPATKARGGDLGWFERGTMVPAFETVAFQLSPGQISEVVETPFGFHILQIESHREPGVAPLVEVQDRIVEVLSAEQRRQLQDTFTASLRQKAKVEIAPDLR